MRWRQLESFIAVCELGSISRAAERLHIAQPALGLQVRGLEDEFGVQLLDRHARGVVPTAAGLRVLEWSREAVQSAQQLKQELRTLGSGVPATLTLGLTPSLAIAFSLTILDAAQQALPNLHVRLTEAPSYVLREWVRDGRVDLALAFDPPDADASDDSVRVLSERLYFVCAAGSAGAAGSDMPISLAEALEQPLAMSPDIDTLRRCVDMAARRIGVPLDVEYEVQSTSVILKLVRHAVAATILPMAMVADDLREGRLAARPIESPSLTRHLRWLRAATPAAGLPLGTLQDLVLRTLRQVTAQSELRSAYHFTSGLDER